MPEVTLKVFHTQHYFPVPYSFPKPANGYDMWLGNGFYFWQDFYFAKWWGMNKKCSPLYSNRYTIYSAELIFEDDEFIDTVFNQEDYYNFCEIIERFAEKYVTKFGKKPTLTKFNQFLESFKIWDSIKIIRFQDLPENDEHIAVSGFFYRKRIQIRVKAPEIITTFKVYQQGLCM
ncbi:MAG TPA: hypothetical protein PLP23_09230 [Panacibacter sp.]|nr:hypothetical protein [Panacibacter sp.]